MQTNTEQSRKLFTKDLTDVWIRLGVIALVAFLCLRIVAPFQGLLLWALILAVALYPIHLRLVKRLDQRQGLAATLLVLIGLLLIGGPTVMLGSSFASHVQDTMHTVESQGIKLEPPPASVAEWPLIGKKVHAVWAAAVDNTADFLQEHEPQIKQFSKAILAFAANTLVGVLTFLGSLIISGIMMAYGESGSGAMQRIMIRLTGPSKGPRLHRLATATIRSVATGVIGVALIQALLLGIGFVIADVPGSGVWAMIVLLLGIAQLPATLVTIPVIVYLWWAGDASTAMNIFYTVYLVVAGLADNVLKPMLLGRGVDAPMPVILLGALGGMVTGGIIGLFIGAVLLAVGYELFMEWVGEADSVESEGAGELEAGSMASPTGD